MDFPETDRHLPGIVRWVVPDKALPTVEPVEAMADMPEQAALAAAVAEGTMAAAAAVAIPVEAAAPPMVMAVGAAAPSIAEVIQAIRQVFNRATAKYWPLGKRCCR